MLHNETAVQPDRRRPPPASPASRPGWVNHGPAGLLCHPLARRLGAVEVRPLQAHLSAEPLHRLPLRGAPSPTPDHSRTAHTRVRVGWGGQLGMGTFLITKRWWRGALRGGPPCPLVGSPPSPCTKPVYLKNNPLNTLGRLGRTRVPLSPENRIGMENRDNASLENPNFATSSRHTGVLNHFQIPTRKPYGQLTDALQVRHGFQSKFLKLWGS